MEMVEPLPFLVAPMRAVVAVTRIETAEAHLNQVVVRAVAEQALTTTMVEQVLPLAEQTRVAAVVAPTTLVVGTLAVQGL